MAKFILLFAAAEDDWDQVPGPEREATYRKIGDWFSEHGRSGKIVGGQELEHSRTAKTVRFTGDKPTVTDGPYMEAKELVGGYAIVEVSDQSEAVELAKTWPGRSAVEVRPLIDHSKTAGAG